MNQPAEVRPQHDDLRQLRFRVATIVDLVMTHVPSTTDIKISEGSEVYIKSARGNGTFSSFFTKIKPHFVSAEDIKIYLGAVGESLSPLSASSGEPQAGSVTQQAALEWWNQMIEPRMRDQFHRPKEEPTIAFVDKAHNVEMRASILMQGGGCLEIDLRPVRLDPIPLKELVSLGLDFRQSVLSTSAGLVLIGGPTSNGKSTTAFSLLDALAQDGRRIVTLENPIEMRTLSNHPNVSQRQVGTDTPSFARGMEVALRMFPSVLFVSEVRDADTARQVIEASATGMLVIATIHGQTAVDSVRRLLSYAGEHLEHMRHLLAQSLLFSTRQALVPRIDGMRWEMVSDVLATREAGVRSKIMENQLTQLEADTMAGKTERGTWMSMNARLVELVMHGAVKMEEAASRSTQRDGDNGFDAMLRAARRQRGVLATS